MHALLGEVNADWYLANTILLAGVLVFHIIGQLAKNYKVPEIVETPMVSSDRNKYEAIYKMRARMALAVFLPLLALNILFSITDKKGIYAFTLTVLIALSVMVYFILLVIYTDVLERDWEKALKERGIAPPEHKFSFSNLRHRSVARAVSVIVVLFLIGYILIRVFR